MYILEGKLSDRAFRGYSLAIEMQCPIIANKIVDRIQGNNYCKKNGFNLMLKL